jgi:type I restriction enzyme S subunit
MNADRLLEHYNRIADAPDAIARLRRFILDLAVRGKLVPQDPANEPASELLKRIVVEKARLVKAGVIRMQGVEPVTPNGVPFELPTNWAWTRIGEICSKTGSGSTPRGGQSAYHPDGVPFLRSQNIYDDGLRLDDVAYIDQATHNRMDGTVVKPDDLLLNITGGSIGRCCLVPSSFSEANISQHVAIVRVAVRGMQAFLHRLILSPYFQSFIFGEQTGAGRGGLPKNRMDRIPVALPPLAEQHRIVAKLDELMALCDRLEAARAGREAARDRLAAASLARLNAPDPHTFQDDARFALDSLPSVTTRPDQIRQLRQTILNLAVRGKLVPQDPKDGTGRELILSLKKARATWEATSRIRKETVGGSAILDKEKYLELPRSWAWARLTELGQTQTGTSPSSANSDLFGNFIPFIKPADLDGNEINYNGPGLSEEGMGHSRQTSVNSVLMVCIGATLGKVNKTTRPVCFNQQINSLTPFLDGLSEYLALALKSSSFQALAWSKAGTGTLPIISKGKWEILPVPLPPLAEQRRIVAKADELMALCDRLEASLADASATRHCLLDTLLVETLAPGEVREKAA